MTAPNPKTPVPLLELSVLLMQIHQRDSNQDVDPLPPDEEHSCGTRWTLWVSSPQYPGSVQL